MEPIAKGLAEIEDAGLLQDLLVEAMQTESLEAFLENLSGQTAGNSQGS